MLRHYKKLIRLRNASRALQSGDPAFLLADDRAQSLAYSRVVGGEVAIVALNRSATPQTLVVPLPQTNAMRAAAKGGFVDGLTGRRISAASTAKTMSLTLAPLQSAVLLPATPKFLSIAARS
jgi:hypothetical protein